MKSLLLLFFSSLLLSCDSKIQEKSPSNIAASTIESEKDSLRKEPPVPLEIQSNIVPDSIDFDSIKINQNIPLLLTEKELIKWLGSPDSLVKEHGWDCGNYLDTNYFVKVYYYGKSRFIASNGKALLHQLYLSDNLFSFSSSDFSIKGTIAESELKKIFPASYQLMIQSRQKNDVPKRMHLRMIKNPFYEDGNFIIYLKDGKLDKIELWWLIC